jgi:hypothetical protein
MKKPKKGLSSFQTFWIFGCGVAFFGVILSNTPLIWTGLLLLVAMTKTVLVTNLTESKMYRNFMQVWCSMGCAGWRYYSAQNMF